MLAFFHNVVSIFRFGLRRLLFGLGSLTLLMSCESAEALQGGKSFEVMFQEDADQARLEHLVYWATLVEEYHDVRGVYPFADTLGAEESYGLVQILTKEQQVYFDPQSPKYRDDLTQKGFTKKSVAAFVSELEKVLGRQIDEYYDIQKVPTTFPIGVQYYYAKDSFLLWTVCKSCGVNEIGTKLMYADFSPTVNISSPSIADPRQKFFTLEALKAHPLYQEWQRRGYHKEAFVRQREGESLHDSKRE